MSETVGDHDPVVMSGGQIGPGVYSESVALETHERHVKRIREAGGSGS